MFAINVTLFVCVLGALGCVTFSVRHAFPNIKTTCPKFEHCSCTNTRRGVMAVCFNVSSAEIEADMARVGRSIVSSLSLRDIQITELPASWFSNQTVYGLSFRNCPLRDVPAATIARIRRLKHALFTNTNLQALPSGLSAAANLMTIHINKNDIKVLKGAVPLPQLVKLDLRLNNIEEVDEQLLLHSQRLRYLLLSKNKIRQLSPYLFNRTKRLAVVHLGSNRITAINTLFDDMRALKILVLERNLITNIEELLKSRMPNLRHIDLGRNHINFIQKFAPFHSQIKELLLNDNNITFVEPEAFHALKELIRLDISRNNLHALNESVFSGNSKLKYLSLSGNRFGNVEAIFKSTKQIIQLDLSSNFISTITGVFDSLKTLKRLSLRGNVLTYVPDNIFSGNVELQKIDMSRNSIKWVGRDAFRGLLTLTDLDLKRNQLLSLNGTTRNLPNLQRLNASLNSIQALESGEFQKNKFLRYLVLTENNISDVKGAFKRAVYLRTLGLSGNRIELLRRSDFPDYMKATMLVYFQHNPLTCDCRAAWLLRRDIDVRLTRRVTCEGPSWLKGRMLYDLTEQDLISWKNGCAPGCRCQCRDLSLGKRDIVVKCSSASLSRLPKVFPEDTTEIDLSDNLLEQLDHSLRRGAPELQFLFLRNNRISKLNLSSLPENVQSLDLRDNRLTNFPRLLVEERNLTTLWLFGNPFLCDCTDYPFRQWVETHRYVVRDAGSIICAKGSNPLVSGKNFLALQQQHLCPPAPPVYATYLVYSMLALAVFLAFAATYLHFKARLKIWLLTCGGRSWVHCMAEEDEDAEKLFDVFLSFSSKDGGWVHEHLLPRLEAMGVSYCTYERNFKGGFLLQDIIRDAITCSRRTLLLLTQNFVESEWCRWEFRLAHRRALEDNMNRLVIVLVDEVDSDALEGDLRLYTRAVNHLRWGEPNFWSRLQRSIAKKEAKRKIITPRPNGATANEVGATRFTDIA